jgi:hypothetical protein
LKCMSVVGNPSEAPLVFTPSTVIALPLI